MELNRELSDRLQKSIEPGKVVILYGPRRAGKTFLLKKLVETIGNSERVKSVLGDALLVQNDLSSLNVEVLRRFVGDATLLIIDEAQLIPNIGANLKLMVDTMPDLKIIASGSAAFDLSREVGAPLVGRQKTLKLYPISARELILNLGEDAQRESLENSLIFGGYPELFSKTSNEERIEYLRSIVQSILLKDILALDNIRNSKKILDLLTLISFQIGAEVSLNELGNSLDLHKDTVARYLDLLEKSFILINIRGFSRNLRKEVTKTSRYYFFDNGIRNAVINNFNPLNLRNDIGMLWENFLVTERLKRQEYNRIMANNYFWRTYDQKEVDWVEEREGRLYGYEFKWKKDKAKAPSDWLEAYDNTEFKLINQENYLDFIA